MNKQNVAVVSDRLYRVVRNVIQEAHGVVSRVANWAMAEANWRVIEAMEGMKTIKMIEGMQGVFCYPCNLFCRFYPCYLRIPLPLKGEAA